MELESKISQMDLNKNDNVTTKFNHSINNLENCTIGHRSLNLNNSSDESVSELQTQVSNIYTKYFFSFNFQ